MIEHVKKAVSDLKSKRLTPRLGFEIDTVLLGLPIKSAIGLTIDPELELYGLSAGLRYGDIIGEGLFDIREDLGPQEFELAKVHWYGYVAMALQLRTLMKDTKGRRPRVKQSAVKERGMKVRIVTPIEACLAYISIFLNSILLKVLDRDPRMKTNGPGPMAEFVTSGFQALGGEGYRSVDMRKATDLMSHDFCISGARGIAKGMGFPPFLAQALKLCVGPMKMKCASGRWVLTCRGILMGCGVSWPMLSLYNLWLWEEAWKVIPNAEIGRRKKVRTVGDDLLGIGPEVVSDAYTRVLELTGGAPSPGKDLFSWDKGVLIEELYDATIDAVAPSLSVRCIQPRPQKVVGAVDTPPWAFGPNLDMAYKTLGSPEWFLDYIKFRFRGPISLLRKSGIHPFVPRQLGGGGFPHSGIQNILATLRPHWVRAVRCAMSQGVEGALHLSTLKGAWTDRFDSPLSKWETNFWLSCQMECMQGCLHLVPGEGEVWPTVSDVSQRVISVVSATGRYISASVAKRIELSPALVRRRLAVVLDRLNSLVPYPQLTEPARNLMVGVTEFLKLCDKPVHPVAVMDVVKVMSVTVKLVQ